MKTVVLAEKPELAKAIATALAKMENSKPISKDGFITVGNYDVSWAYGHLLKLKEFESYDQDLKKWNIETLPIYFENWEHEVDDAPYKVKQLKVIQNLLKSADQVINAGDPDDEGQYLIDEILNYYNFKKDVKRVLINDNNTEYVIKALKNLKDNKEYENLGKSAYARAISDNIFGKNLTRYFTIKSGNLIKIGRVQTPTLALVVNRDREIENHTKSYYYNFGANVTIDNKEINLKHTPKDKIEIKQEAQDLVEDLSSVKSVEAQIKKSTENKKAPLGYNLVELQAEANTKYGYSTQKTLDITQELREKYKAITYNRSDCRYLGEENFADAPKILPLIQKRLKGINYDVVDTKIKGEIFDNSKITAHHAIIPTTSNFEYDNLTKEQKNIYDLIATRYLEQFCESATYEKTTVKAKINDCEFSASSSKLLKGGWQEIRGIPKSEYNEIETLDSGTRLANVNSIEVLEVETKPKARYTEATLIKDMVSISKYVTDNEIKKLLIEKDKDKQDESGSIGTPATRSTIISKLIESGYLENDGKKLVSTPIAREFLDKLPEEAKSINNTAIWYQIQEEIKNGTKEPRALEQKVLKDISSIMGTEMSFTITAKSNNTSKFGKELSPYLDPITNEPLYQKPTAKDPKKMFYTRGTYDKENPIGYVLTSDTKNLYEMNSKETYPVKFNPEYEGALPKPTTSKSKSTKFKK